MSTHRAYSRLERLMEHGQSSEGPLHLQLVHRYGIGITIDLAGVGATVCLTIDSRGTVQIHNAVRWSNMPLEHYKQLMDFARTHCSLNLSYLEIPGAAELYIPYLMVKGTQLPIIAHNIAFSLVNREPRQVDNPTMPEPRIPGFLSAESNARGETRDVAALHDIDAEFRPSAETPGPTMDVAALYNIDAEGPTINLTPRG